MPKLYLLLMLAFLAACSKDRNSSNNNNNNTLADGTVQYKVNGSLVTIAATNNAIGESATFIKQLKGSPNPQTYYLLNANKGTNDQVGFAIVSDSSEIRNYTYDSTFGTSL